MSESQRHVSEEQARRLWERAAELQAEAAARREEEARQEEGAKKDSPGLLSGEVHEAGAYSLTHVRQAGVEAGIPPEFFNLALAEEAILEMEGGSGERDFDRVMQRFLGDGRRALEVRKQYAFPTRDVWASLEKTVCAEPYGLDLLDVREEQAGTGMMAILESYSHASDGSLAHMLNNAGTRRLLVRVTPVKEKDGSEVLIRVPLRSSRRSIGGFGLGVVGVAGLIGGAKGLGVAAGLAGAGALGTLPLALLLAGGGLAGFAGVGGLTRYGFRALYRLLLRRLTRYGFRALYRLLLRRLDETLVRTLDRVHRDLERAEEQGNISQGSPTPP
jgi:hypothetical protein